MKASRVLALAIGSVACAPAPPAPYAPIPPAHVLPVWTPIRYATPVCPLTYEEKTTEADQMDGAPPGLGAALETLVRFELRPDGDRVTLAGALTSLTPKGGKYRYYVPENRGYADVHLETDGLRWIERDGPTSLFDRLGTQGGLVWFFPDLPTSGEPAATADWTIPPVDYIAMLRTEVARGKQRGMAEALKLAEAAVASTAGGQKKEDPAVRAKVRLERHVEVRGVPASELSLTADAEFSDDEEEQFGLRVRAKMSQRGTLTVLGSGQILRADLERVMTIDMTGSGPDTSQHHVQTCKRQLRLVGACGGPTEAPLVAPLSREERALAAWGDAWYALVDGDRTKFLDAFESSLVAKLGADVVWTALVGFRLERGDPAIALEYMEGDADFVVEGEELRLQTHGIISDGKGNSLVPFEVVVTMHESGGRWRVASLRGDVVLYPRTMVLEVSPQRLVVKKGWPPK